jgi:hypothetical protein
MQPRHLEPGDVVQIDPEYCEVFGASFMIVTEPKSWGAQGYIHALPGFNEDGTKSKGGRAYKRVEFEHMEYIGKAEWLWESMSD